MEFQNPEVGGLHPDARRIGKAARADFQKVFPGWDGQTVSPDDEALHRAIEAQIAAASLGRKPLYFDPWPREQAEQLAARLQRHLPKGTEVHAADEGLFVYRPQSVRAILDADPAFYRPNAESDLVAILEATRKGENGDLLGYGARNWERAGRVEVSIMDGDRTIFVFFVSDPSRAEFFAQERAKDLTDYLGKPIRYEIVLPEKSEVSFP